MGIYHLSFKSISRNRGQSAVASSAYRRAAQMRDERLGKNFNFLHKNEVVYNKLIIPNNSPSWLKDIHAITQPNANAEKFWNLVEATEQRKDANLCYEIVTALPNEFSLEESISLIDEFIENSFTKRGMVADYSLHFKEGNHHAHILLSTRELTETGFGAKVVAWKQKKAIYTWREAFATYANQHLIKNGLNYQISHKSNIDRGIELIPTVHEGHVKNSDKAELNKQIRDANLEKVRNNPELAIQHLSSCQNSFSLDEVGYELNKLYSPNSINPAIIKNALDAISQEEKTNLPNLTIQDLSLNEIVFSDKDLSRAINLKTSSADEFTATLLKIKANLIYLGPGDDGRDRYTTRASYELENALQDVADELASSSKYKIKVSQSLIDKYHLNPAQAKALRHILGGNDLAAIVGYAGTGKSYLMGCAKEAWERNGYKVRGIALAGIAAEGLEEGSKIQSTTIALFKMQLEKEPLAKNEIVVLDEAGMVDSYTMATIVSAVKQAGAKLVMLGDGAQLSPIGAGVPFKAITERVGFAVLDEVIRQSTDWQKAATCEFAKYQTKSALSRYAAENKILLSHNAQDELLDAWQEALKKDGLTENIILALSNKEVTELNLAARARLFKDTPEISLITQNGIKQITLGERILFLKNDYKLGVKNGSKGTVIELQKTPVVKLDNGKIIHLSHGQHIDYGYATTVHKAQGITVNNAFVMFSPYWYKNLVYVAMSRHRIDVKCYADAKQHKSIPELIDKLSSWQIKDSVIGWPINFSFRHGVEAKNFAERIVNSIKQALNNTFNHAEHQKEQAQLRQIKQQQTDLLNTREDARLVAKYADLNALSVKLWREQKLEELKDVTTKRQNIAHEITSNIGKYHLALEQNKISIERLWKDRDAHLSRITVKHYMEQTGINKEKCAAKLYASLKKHYPIIKEEMVNTKQLQNEAALYTKRMFLKELTSNERKVFYLVEKYHANSIDTAKAWGRVFNKISNPNDALTNKAIAEKLSLNQAKLAHTMCNNLKAYAKSLEFHNISPGKEFPFVPTATELTANKKYFKLTQHAYRYTKHLAYANHNKDNLEPESSAKQTSINNAAAKLQQEKQFFDVNLTLSKLKDNAREVATGILGQATKRSTKDTLYFGKNQGSICVKVQGSNSGLWYDFSTGEGGNLIQLAEKEYGLEFKEALKYCANQLGVNPSEPLTNFKKPKQQTILPTAATELTVEQKEKAALAQTIFTSSCNIQGTLAETYLSNRGIVVTESTNLGFAHVFEPETKQIMPALVVAGRDKNNDIQTVQVTYLSNDAKKAQIKIPKRTYGTFNGATVLIQEGKGDKIAIAEGLETGLSIANTNKDLSVAISFGSLAKITLPENKTTVIICADHDLNNTGTENSLTKTIDRFTTEKSLVYVVKPDAAEQDFNDVLKTKGIEEVNKKIKDAKLITKHMDDNKKLDVYKNLQTTTSSLVSKINKSPTEDQDFTLALRNKRKLAYDLQASTMISQEEKEKLQIDARLHQEKLFQDTPEHKIINEYKKLLDEYDDLLLPKKDLDPIQQIQMRTIVAKKIRESSFNISQNPDLLKEAKQNSLDIAVAKHTKQYKQNMQSQSQMVLGNEVGRSIDD
jgi:ATP-dependent exoDNAse (exonuclease V) alpha subunit